MKWLLILLFRWSVCGLLTGFSTVSASASTFSPDPGQPPSIRTAYLRDPSGTLTLPQALASPNWTSYEELLFLGYTPDTVWVRIQVNPGPRSGPLSLQIRPRFLDDLTIYLDEGQRQWRTVQTGDRHPEPATPTVGMPYGFAWSPTPHENTIMLRVATTSTMMMHVTVLPLQEGRRQAEIEQVLLSLLMGAVLFAAFYSGWLALGMRDVILSAFALYAFLSVLMMAGLQGFLARYLGGIDSDKVSSLLVLSASIAGTFFHLVFLASLGLHRIGRKLLAIPTFMVLICMALYLAGWEQLALQANAGILGLASLIVMPLILSLPVKGESTRRWLILGYGLLMAYIANSVLPLLGFLQHGMLSLYLTPMHVLLSVFVLSLLLKLRLDHQARAERQARESALLTTTQLQATTYQRDEKARFLAMMTHELRGPLSVIRTVLGDPGMPAPALGTSSLNHARTAVRDINELVSRCLEADRLEAGHICPQMMSCPLAATLALVAVDTICPERIRIESSSVPTACARSDPDLLRMMLSNLVDNALKYSPPDSLVTCRWAKDARGQLALEVCNLPGQAGWPSADSVFEKYYRAPDAKSKTGSGLGLYLVRGTARALGGDLRYTPTDTLVVFTLTLPLDLSVQTLSDSTAITP